MARHRRLVGFGLLVWSVAELVEALAARLLTVPLEGEVTVVVPGFRNRNPARTNAVNRWRARVAVRTARRYGSGSRILACGGDPAGTGVPEAVLLSSEVRRLGFTGEVILERESRTTKENARCVAPMLADAERVAVASNPLHGLKLRVLLGRFDPALRRRFVASSDYRMGELGPLRLLTTVVGLHDLLRARPR
jgi:gdmH-like transport-associated protein